MTLQSIALYDSNVTIIMVVVFGLVCLALVGFLIKAMSSSNNNNNNNTETKD